MTWRKRNGVEEREMEWKKEWKKERWRKRKRDGVEERDMEWKKRDGVEEKRWSIEEREI